MANDNSIEANIEFPNNTGPLVQGLQNVSALGNEIREDFRAISDYVDGINERAERMHEFWQQNLDAIQGIKSLLEVVQTITQTNQSGLSNYLNQVNEILSSVRGLGGNMGQAMSMLGYGNNPMSSQNFAAYAQSGGGTAPQDFSSYAASSVASSSAGFGGRGGFFRGRRNRGGGGGGGVPPYDGSAGYEDDDFGNRRSINTSDLDSVGVIEGADSFGTSRDSRSDFYGGRHPSQIEIRRQLNQYPTISRMIPTGQEGRAAEHAYNIMDANAATFFNKIPVVGKAAYGRFKQALGGAGITKDAIKQAQTANTQQYRDPETDMIYNVRSGGMTPVEEQTTKIADTFVKLLGNKMVQHLNNYAGYAQVASAAFGFAGDIAGGVRQATGFAQAQGNAFGQTNYGRSIGMTLGAYLQSGFGLNPFYSAQDVMQAQMMGASLGLKGSQLQNYVNQALNFQTQYGLNSQQTQQILGAGLGVGVGINTNAGYFGQVRALENSTTTSTAYGNQAYLQGMMAAAGAGAGPNAASYIGLSSAKFGASNLIVQANGLTGNELMGTDLGYALFAQQDHIPFLQSYAAMQSMGGEKAQTLTDQGVLRLLANFGININSSDQDLNNQAIKLEKFYQQIGISKVTTPQIAVNYTRALLNRYNTETSLTNGGITQPTVKTTAGNYPALSKSLPAQISKIYEQFGLTSTGTPKSGTSTAQFDQARQKSRQEWSLANDVQNTFTNVSNEYQAGDFGSYSKKAATAYNLAERQFQQGNYQQAAQTLQVEITFKGEAAAALKAAKKITSSANAPTHVKGTH